MLLTDTIKLDAYLFDLEFAENALKEHIKDDDDKYAAAYSIVHEQFRRLEDYYTRSPRIYRGEEKTLEVISDTLEGGDVGYFANGKAFYNVGEKSLKTIHEWINDDSYIFIRFFEGVANYQYVQLSKKGD